MTKKNKSLELDEKGDVGQYADLISFLINAVADELHSNFSYIADQNDYWIKLGKKERLLRTKYQKLLCGSPKTKGEVWCKSKHKLIKIMNLIELGNRYSQDDMNSQAKECYKDAGEVLNEVFEINNIGGK